MIRRSAIDERVFRNDEVNCFSVRTKLKSTGNLTICVVYAEAIP